MVARYREEIPDYAALDEEALFGDVMALSRHNFDALLSNLERGAVLQPEELDHAREVATRRVHAGVSLESLLHAYRLWGQVVWESVLAVARTDRPDERESALRIAGWVFEHIDVVSTASAQAYLDEMQGVWVDRETVRRDLLDALVGGRGEAEAAQRQASGLGIELRDHYVVVLARAPEPAGGDEYVGVRRTRLRQAIGLARSHLRPDGGALLIGLREGEVVALWPAPGPQELDAVRAGANALAAAAADHGTWVGFGTWHPGLHGVAASYAEAREALAIAEQARAPGRAVGFDEVVVDHMIRTSPQADRVLDSTLAPLVEYDKARGSSLVTTLRTYYERGFSLSRTAEVLVVHPNTVVYRLKRIHELTGRDPRDPDDLLLLSLALKLVPG